MKITINDKSEKKEIKYPCLMISKNNNMIVFFESSSNGTVLAQGTSNLSIGEGSKSFAMDLFKPFTGTITLQNSED